MNRLSTRALLLLIIAVVVSITMMQMIGTESSTTETTHNSSVDKRIETHNIQQLTHEKAVAKYIHENRRLPKFYLTKKSAKKRGWNPGLGDLCEKIPGHAIGGDPFGNREGKLPTKKGRKYFEADINYNCGAREAERIIYSNDGLIFITKDHYKTFKQF